MCKIYSHAWGNLICFHISKTRNIEIKKPHISSAQVTIFSITHYLAIAMHNNQLKFNSWVSVSKQL